ncbi:MAG: HAD family hydrolase [Patescibacteria group bacterium]|nr:HAD family hydrolase [Patescibacteria group bacterium]
MASNNVIFDWSGVIRDCVHSVLWVINQMFERYGARAISLDEFREHWVQPYMAFYTKYLPNLGLEEEQRAYNEIQMRPDCPACGIFPGTAELILMLRQRGDFLAVITSDGRATFMPELDRFGLTGVFDQLVMDVHDKTPPLREMVTRLGMNPDESYVVGDSNHEIEAGQKVGIRTIGVTWGFSPRERLRRCRPDHLVDSVTELAAVLLI